MTAAVTRVPADKVLVRLDGSRFVEASDATVEDVLARAHQYFLVDVSVWTEHRQAERMLQALRSRIAQLPRPTAADFGGQPPEGAINA